MNRALPASRPRAVWFTVAASLALLLTITQDALAGGRLPCGQAGVFSNAAVNALILPYRTEAGEYFDVYSAGARLSALIQQETLFSMLKYGSVGATELVTEGGEICDVRRVLDQVTSESGNRRLREGHGLVIIWGRIYEEEEHLFVQSYVRFLRKSEAEALTIDLKDSEDERLLTLHGSLPSRAVAMLPRRMTRDDLEEIESRARETLVLRDEPDEDDTDLKPLQRFREEPLTYGVIAVEGEWMKVRCYVTGREGWVRPRVETEDWALRQFLPELHFLEGVIAYLRLRSASVAPLHRSPADLYGWMSRSFARYEEAVGRDAVPAASGLASAMLGMARYTELEGTEARYKAAEHFQVASSYLPASPAARQLATITSPLLAPEPVADSETVAALNRGLLAALAVAPSDRSVLENLRRLYDFAALTENAALYETDELSRRRDAIADAIASIP